MFKLVGFLKAHWHVLVTTGNDHNIVEGRDDQKDLALLGCTCDKVFWLRQDIVEVVKKHRELKAEILKAWR